MSPQLVILLIVSYFGTLLLTARFTRGKADNQTFFTANRQSPWFLVAFGMIGASLSGVTFISVPGDVGTNSFYYLQMVLGYLLGYLVIGTVLLPLYYRLNLVSIYGYLQQRLGFWAYKTGAAFFLLSRVIGAAFRLYLVAEVLHLALFSGLGVSFFVTVLVTIALIWLYTFQGGIKTIVWTDTLQTASMLAAVVVTLVVVSRQLGWSIGEMIEQVRLSPLSEAWNWDPAHPKFFGRQFFAGAFIAIVMTGLDQDMMQKNLTIRTLRDAQKNMFWFSIVLVGVNLLFLALGAVLYLYSAQMGLSTPDSTDLLYPTLALEGHFPLVVGILFLLGTIAAAYSSADSALTALTTSFCVDFLGMNDAGSKRNTSGTRLRVHLGFSLLLFLVIIGFRAINDRSVISQVFTAAGYTYGPLLGLFSFGLFTRLQVPDKAWVLVIGIFSPLLWYVLKNYTALGKSIDFELLIYNGATTFLLLALLALARPNPQKADG